MPRTKEESPRDYSDAELAAAIASTNLSLNHGLAKMCAASLRKCERFHSRLEKEIKRRASKNGRRL